MYVTDRNHRVSVFNTHGQFLKCFGKKGNREGELFNPEVNGYGQHYCETFMFVIIVTIALLYTNFSSALPLHHTPVIIKSICD